MAGSGKPGLCRRQIFRCRYLSSGQSSLGRCKLSSDGGFCKPYLSESSMGVCQPFRADLSFDARRFKLAICGKLGCNRLELCNLQGFSLGR
ncbi:hypothetical protein D3C76_1131540 [compost metagenome]